MPEQAQCPPARRGGLFKLLAVCLPLLLVAGLEVLLRVGGYGFPTGFFHKIRQNGQEFLANSDTFTYRFFPPELVRWPEPFLIPAIKSADTTRIFIFGESAAMGDPQPAYGAGRFLEVLLRERFPGRKFEIVNTGITAINSHVILPIAQECAQQQGDIWIIYMGNNEMVGPFGAATIFGGQAPPLAMVRMNLALQQLRVGQLAKAALRRIGGASTNATWEGMRMFLQNQISPDDPRRASANRNFEANLGGIVRAGLGCGAKVVLSTMSVNLGDCPPFASMGNPHLPAAERARFDKVLAEGLAQEKAGDVIGAARSFEQAAGADPQFAEAHYRWAECLRQGSNQVGPPATAALLKHYQAACDTDALPFRADSQINGIIRRVGAQFADRGLVLSDAESALAERSPGGIPGDEVFYEHVHFSLRGNYLLGRLWAEEVVRALSTSPTATNTIPWASQETCERDLGLTIWNRSFLLDMVVERMQKPPLSSQPNNQKRLARLQAELNAIHIQRAGTNEVYHSGEELMRAIQRAPRDHWLYENLAGLYEAVGDLKRAAGAYRKIHELLPPDFYGNLQLGRFLGRTGQSAEGEPLLREAARQRPYVPDSWVELGNACLAQAKYASALEAYERAATLRPREASYVASMGAALIKLNRREEGIAAYRRAIGMRPEAFESHFELATELVAGNNLDEAAREYEEAIRLDPGHLVSRINLGVVLFRQNRIAESIQLFEAALQINPADAGAAEYLRQARARAVPAGR